MTVARRLTRPMLASIFVAGGVDTLRDPGPRVELAADVATSTAEALPVGLPDDAETLVKLDAVAKVAGGAMLAAGGRTARLGAAICAASLVPTTLAGHRFWEETDPEQRARQQIDFVKNVSILGGLLIAALDTGGRPSVPWRAKRRAAKVQRAAKAHLPTAPGSRPTLDVGEARAVASDFAHEHLVPLGQGLSTRAAQVSGRVADADLPERVGGIAHDVGGRAAEFAGRAADAATSPRARALRKGLAHRASDIYDRAADVASAARSSDLAAHAAALQHRAVDAFPLAS